MRPVGYVSLPCFSRLQNDRPALRDAVATCLRTTLILTVPAMLVMAACSGFLMAVIGLGGEPRRRAEAPRLRRDRQGDRLLHGAAPVRRRAAAPAGGHALGARCALCRLGRARRLAADRRLDPRAGDRDGGLARAFFLAIVIPVNVAVVCWITGLRPAAVRPLAPGRHSAAAAGIALRSSWSWPGSSTACPRSSG